MFDPGGNFLFYIGKKGSGSGEFRHPVGLAFDSLGRLFVSDRNNHRIQVFTSKGNFIGSFGSMGTEPGRFTKPADLDFDQNDRLYVVDKGNRRVQVFEIR